MPLRFRPIHALLALLLFAAPAAAQSGGEAPGRTTVLGNLRVTLPAGFSPLTATEVEVPLALENSKVFGSARGDVAVAVILANAGDAPPNPPQSFRDSYVPGLMIGMRHGVTQQGGRVLEMDTVSTPEMQGAVMRADLPDGPATGAFRVLIPRRGDIRVIALMVIKRGGQDDDPEVRAVFDAIRLETIGGAEAR